MSDNCHVIACLWNGTDLPKFSAGRYGPEYVEALKSGLARHWPGARLTVLTDGSYTLPNTEQRMLSKGWPGWWRRFEAFHPDLWPEEDGRLVLLDLDLILVGDCEWIGRWDLATVGLPLDPFFPDRVCSTVVTADRKGAELLWEAAVHVYPQDYKYMGQPSEMALLRVMAKSHCWEPLEPAPSRLLSYKAHVKKGHSWTDASIVYFHGEPKPADLDDREVLKSLWLPH